MAILWDNSSDYDSRFDGDGSEPEVCSHGEYGYQCIECREEYEEWMRGRFEMSMEMVYG
jgi:hypothetical protein